ncbi:MAG TPA: hypothetical protein VGD67_29420, partial [Pseudonocardiaceae bacterium]
MTTHYTPGPWLLLAAPDTILMLDAPVALAGRCWALLDAGGSMDALLTELAPVADFAALHSTGRLALRGAAT